VSEEQIIEALRLYFNLVNLKCEPTGALPLGAVLNQPEKFDGKRVCLVVTGGNVDPAAYSKLIS
jgi:threonine dehydratase